MHVVFWTTDDCNLNCSYCYNRIGNNIQKHYMSNETADAAIDLLTKQESWDPSNEIAVHFHVGEPLLNCGVIEHIMERFEALVPRENLRYGMTTNGTLYDDRRKKIIDKIDELSVSLDGKAEIHDLNRKFPNGSGSFERVIRNAKDIRQRNDFRLRMTVTHDTIKYLYDTVCFLIEEGFRRIIPVLDMYDSHWEDSDEPIIFEQFGKIKKYIEDNEYGDVIISYVTESEFTRKGECSGGVESFHFLPDGKIYPCSMTVGDSEWVIGHTDTGLCNEKIEELQRINKKETTSCSGCGMYRYCTSSRCKLINKKLTGDYYTASSIACLSSRLEYEFSRVNTYC